MASKRRVIVPLSIITLTGLISAFAGQILPEPTDPLTLFEMDWVTMYRGQLDPLLARFADLWAFYVFAGIWYLFLVAVVIQFGKRKEAIQSLLKIVTVFVILYIAAFWLGATPQLPMAFETGMQVLLGSILVFTFLMVFIVWKLSRQHTHVEFK